MCRGGSIACSLRVAFITVETIFFEQKKIIIQRRTGINTSQFLAPLCFHHFIFSLWRTPLSWRSRIALKYINVEAKRIFLVYGGLRSLEGVGLLWNIYMLKQKGYSNMWNNTHNRYPVLEIINIAFALYFNELNIVLRIYQCRNNLSKDNIVWSVRGS